MTTTELHLAEGQNYSENKNEFKKLLKKHDIKWKGSPSNCKWESDETKVEAVFYRENDVTKSAKFYVTDKTEDGNEQVSEIIDWLRGIGAEEPENKVEEIDEDFRNLLNYHYKNGAPEGYLKAIRKDWIRKRSHHVELNGVRLTCSHNDCKEEFDEGEIGPWLTDIKSDDLMRDVVSFVCPVCLRNAESLRIG